MRRPIVAANWKMNVLTEDEVLARIRTVRNGTAKLKDLEIVIFPPTIYISAIEYLLRFRGRVRLGIQNIYYRKTTGEISPDMAREYVEYALVGHSERRKDLRETDIDVNRKIFAALDGKKLHPIVCVGEKKRSKHPIEPVKQLEAALNGLSRNSYSLIDVAYEPAWAIGTGKNAEPSYASKVADELREIIGHNSSILYGGSVNPKNARKYARRSEIDGLLVGGASLIASRFVQICQMWAGEKLGYH